jgi:chromatin remodeling complex protein RSC6
MPVIPGHLSKRLIGRSRYFSLAKFLTPLLKRPEDVGVVTVQAEDEDEDEDEQDEEGDSADEDEVGLSSSDSEEEEATAAPKPKQAKAGSKAQPKASAGADGPKRPTSAYFYYNADRREWFKTQQPELKMTEVAKLVGAEWKALSEKQRKKYTDLAAKDKARYEREKGKGKAKGKRRTKTQSKAAGGQKQPNTGGLNAPMVLSTELQAVCGGERVLSRAQAVKHIWIYIKANGLQKPENKQMIQCDAPLLKITGGQQEIPGFGISKFLGAHLSKPTEDDAQ